MLQIIISCTEKAEQLISDGLFHTQTVIVSLWKTDWVMIYWKQYSAFQGLEAQILSWQYSFLILTSLLCIKSTIQIFKKAIPQLLSFSPMLFSNCMHSFMCGKRRNSLHFRLLPLRFAPLPTAQWEKEKNCFQKEFYSLWEPDSGALKNPKINDCPLDVHSEIIVIIETGYLEMK